MQIKSSRPADAIKSASNALEVDGLTDADRAKAYYRRGQAYGKCKEDELAVEDLKRALEIIPEDAGVLGELNAAKQRIKMRREREKKAYAKMFS